MSLKTSGTLPLKHYWRNDMLFRMGNKKLVVRQKIFEMAFNKNKYKNFVYGLYPQIAQNWCLCMYCKLHRPELITTYLHWRSELETHIGRLNSKSIDKPRDRKKWTHEAMITEADMDKPDVVFGECRIKFRHENDNGLNMSMLHQHEVCELFANNVMDVIECIGSTSDITEYTRKVFPDNY